MVFNSGRCRYYRSLSEMFRLATLYMKENNLEKGFVLYVRFVRSVTVLPSAFQPSVAVETRIGVAAANLPTV